MGRRPAERPRIPILVLIGAALVWCGQAEAQTAIDFTLPDLDGHPVSLSDFRGRSSALRVFYGADKGGVKCAGGICRFFPPFEGLRIEALIWF